MFLAVSNVSFILAYNAWHRLLVVLSVAFSPLKDAAMGRDVNRLIAFGHDHSVLIIALALKFQYSAH